MTARKLKCKWSTHSLSFSLSLACCCCCGSRLSSLGPLFVPTKWYNCTPSLIVTLAHVHSYAPMVQLKGRMRERTNSRAKREREREREKEREKEKRPASNISIVEWVEDENMMQHARHMTCSTCEQSLDHLFKQNVLLFSPLLLPRVFKENVTLDYFHSNANAPSDTRSPSLSFSSAQWERSKSSLLVSVKCVIILTYLFACLHSTR